jgi:hypothetical protein
MVLAMAVMASLIIVPGRPSLAQGLKAQIQTERGCGPNTVYSVGDVLTVTFEIDGAPQAQALIEGVFPDGRSVPLYPANGIPATVPGNQPITQDIANIGGSLGPRSVRLTATAYEGRLKAQATCSFTVASVQLKAQIATDRGCGSSAVYTVGDQAQILFRIDGTQQAQALIQEITPDGQTQAIFNQVVPGNTLLALPRNIQGAAGTRRLRLTATPTSGGAPAQAECSFTVAAVQIKAQISTDRGCGSGAVYTVGDQAQILFRIDGTQQAQALIQEVTPDGQIQPIFNQAVPGNTLLALPHNIQGLVGTRTVRLTATTNGGASAQAECSFIVQSVPLPVQKVLAVGDPIAAVSRIGMFDMDPVDQDKKISSIRLAADDGSLFVADYAGSSLLRVGIGAQVAAVRHAAARLSPPLQVASAGSQILLDTTGTDPVDGVGLARLLRVETGRDGTHAILALRADNNRAIYRLSNGVLARLALVPGPTGAVELAIGDSGQIAYVAPTSAGPVVLSQVVGGPATVAPRPVQLLQQGQTLQGPPVVNGATIQQFSQLTSNGAGDLTVVTLLRQPNGSSAQALIRKTSQGLFLVAATGQTVLRGRGNGNGLLLQMIQPRIGPDATIVFLGTGDGFANFYIQGTNRPLQPLLVGANWNTANGTFDYEIAADGTAAVRALQGQSTVPALFLITKNGAVLNVPPGDRILPVGRPVFGPDGTGNLLLFLAQNLDRPVDRNGNIPVVLCRSRLVNGSPVVDAVAAPGQPVPGKPGFQLLTITQRPVVSASGITFGALYGGNVHFPVPAAGLFRVPPGGTLANATLVTEEGADLPGAGRVAILRSLTYTSDGTLLFGGLVPGAGSIVATVTPPHSPSIAARAHTAAAARIQAGAPMVAPLLAIGQPLDRPDRILQAVLGRFEALGSDRQLVVARFSQTGGIVGEGLFTVAHNGTVQAVAVTGDPAPGLAGVQFAAFSDSTAYTLNPPSVSMDGSVVFKARLDQGGTPTFGLFQWNGTSLLNVGLANPNPDNLALTPDDQPPYSFDRWSAGPGGSAYLMERHETRSAVPETRLFEHFPVGLAPLVIPGLTPVAGGGLAGPLVNLLDYVLDSAGNVFVQGTAGGVPGVLSVGPAALSPVVRQGLALPAPADGTNVQGLVFDGNFSLMPDSERGALLFRAGVTPQGTPPSGRQGLFRLSPQGVQTLMVESLAVGGSRDLTFGTLATTPDRQTISGITAFATFNSGHWSIFRWKAGQTTLVAQEGGTLPGGAHVVSLDPGPVLDLPPGAGPVFTLNQNGDVAFLATDGTRWGIYLFSNTGP